jgi:hypothetical protein
MTAIVRHMNLQWTELHLRPLEGIVVTFPVRPEHASSFPGGGAVQVGPMAGLVPPGALVQGGIRPANGGVMVLVPRGELLTGVGLQTVTWNDIIVHR